MLMLKMETYRSMIYKIIYQKLKYDYRYLQLFKYAVPGQLAHINTGIILVIVL